MYKVIVCASKMPIPIPFILHTWIVTEHNGVKDRCGVLGFFEDIGERQGYLYKNHDAPDDGIHVFGYGRVRFFKRLRWNSYTLYNIDGDDNSEAKQIYDLLHGDHAELPFIDTYHMLKGPNSNSFTQWVLDHVALGKYPLPKRAWGRGWKG